MTSVRDTFIGCILVLLAGGSYAQSGELTREQAEKLTLDAVALYRSGDSTAALANLDRALAFYRHTGDRASQEEVLYARGMVLAKKGEHAKALESFKESLSIAREIGSKGEATVLHDMAHTFIDMRQYAEAAQAFEAERAAHARTGDRKAEGEAVHNLGFVEAAQSRDDQALARLDQALAIRREVGDRDGEARTLEIAAFVHGRARQPQKALELYEKALAIWRAVGEAAKADQTQTQIAGLRGRLAGVQQPPTEKQRAQSSQANDLNNECIALMTRGDHAGARATCERARDLFRRAGDRSGEAMALVAAGMVDFMRGDYMRAHRAELQALALARETGSEELQANAVNNLALIHLARAQYPQALTYFERALTIFRKYHDLLAEERTIGNLAGVHLSLGHLTEATEMYEKVLPRQRGKDRAGILISLGVIRSLKKDFTAARDLLQQAVAIQRTLGDPLIRTSLGNLGTVHAELGENAKAMEYLQEALALDRKLGDRASESGELARIAEIHARQDEPAKALELYQRALELVREIGAPPAEAHVLAGIARIHESQGRLQPALDAYQQAIAIEETVRAGGQTEEIKTALAERSSDVYQRTGRLLVRLGRPADAFDLTERARGRTFLDQLGNTGVEVRAGGAGEEIEQERLVRLAVAGLNRLLMQEKAKPGTQQNADRIRTLSSQLAAKRREYAEVLTRLKISDPEYASLISISPLKLPELQRLLDADTTLLSYFVTADTTLAFVVTREAFQAVELPVSEKELNAAIDELRSFASVGGPPSPALARLSASLIEPLLPLLKTPLVGIVPHGTLHLLPFAALRGKKAGSWLGDDYTLFHLPTGSSLPFIQQKRKAARGDLFAVSQGRAAGLPPLRHAENEAQTIAALFGTTALIGGAATETAFRERAGRSGILHIAAHGQLNAAAPLFSRLVLAADDEFETARDGSLEVREIYGLDLKQASLVVLSACQTQLGAQSRGDEVVGLSRAFIYAGTPAVLASLWSVDDVATASLMTSFYGHLRKGVGNAAALRAAQAETRGKHPDPYYWASFVLTGDPR